MGVGGGLVRLCVRVRVRACVRACLWRGDPLLSVCESKHVLNWLAGGIPWCSSCCSNLISYAPLLLMILLSWTGPASCPFWSALVLLDTFLFSGIQVAVRNEVCLEMKYVFNLQCRVLEMKYVFNLQC